MSCLAPRELSEPQGRQPVGGSRDGCSDSLTSVYQSHRPSSPSDALVIESTQMVVNESGADRDLRVESDTLTHAFYMNGGTGNVGIGTDAPANELHIKRPDGNIGILFESETANQALRMSLSDGT